MSDSRVLLDLLTKPVALISEDLTVLDANRAFAEHFGPSCDAAPPGRAAQFWEDLARTVERMRPAAKFGRFRWSGGRPEPRPFDVSLTRVGEHDLLVHADDVSAYVTVASIQQGVRGYVERVLNHIDRAVVGLDADLRVTFFNQAQAELWRRAGAMPAVDAVGEPVAHVYPVFDTAEWTRIAEGVRRHEPLRHARVVWPAAGRVLDVSVLPLDRPGETVTGAVCLTDVIGPAPE